MDSLDANGQQVIYVARDFKRDNPVSWVSVDGQNKGRLKTNTQLNSDLDIHVSGDRLRLAFSSQGVRGANQKA